MPTKLSPLTEAEQAAAEQHLNLVFRFLQVQQLPTDEWFDVVIFRYLLTVKNWFSRPDLHQYQFSTIAWRAMRSAVGHERDKQNRRIKTVSLDAPLPGTDGLTLGDVVTTDQQVYNAYRREVCRCEQYTRQKENAAPSGANTGDSKTKNTRSV
ncbi:MAG: hypothetical protein K2O18_14400 [Oscillospiraceae bacterium]|nr:hypothetical protein [Oscillospiraceae bacterium]